ncbi:MAG: hypothetical protein QUS14_09470, partial [Pyrinomonadaceae bacterium]|nr:hypothetical protein [Pyrinomonadaceae bacterium]
RTFPLRSLLFLLLVSGIAYSQTPRVFQEQFVLRSLGKVQAAQITYSAVYGNGQFAPTLQALRNVEMIDAALASGTKYGYVYSYTNIPSTPTEPAGYRLTATPRLYRKTGINSYYIDAAGVLRGGDLGGRPATASDPVLNIDLCTNGGIPQNEHCTVATVRSFHGAQATYAATAGNGNFGTLAQLANAGLVDARLAGGTLRGYSYTVTVVNANGQTPAAFTLSAVPQNYGTSGVRSFFIDQTGVLRGADRQGQPAGPNDPPIDGLK